MRKRRLLIVDDDEGIRQLFEIALGLEGFEVRSAADGLEGLASAHTFRPDVIVLDLMMPGLNGYELLTAVRSAPDLAAIPVILATALSPVEHAGEDFLAEAQGYLTKPFDVDALVTAVGRVTAPPTGPGLIARAPHPPR